MRDPSSLYATIAQINATLTAIIGGFLLTYGLGLETELRRVMRTHKRMDLVLEEVSPDGDVARKHREDHEATLAALTSRRRSTFTQLIRGHITQDQANTEYRRLDDEEVAAYEAYLALRMKERDRLLALEADKEQVRASLEDMRSQLRRVVRAFIFLALLLGLGVGLPVAYMPKAAEQQAGGREDVVGYAFMALLGIFSYMLLTIMWVDQPNPMRGWWQRGTSRLGELRRGILWPRRRKL